MDGTSVSVALAGSGGAGVMTAGNMLLEAAAQANPRSHPPAATHNPQ